MKILCVCSHGTVRSVALAYVLKCKGHEAIPIGADTASQETLSMLANWADKILVVDFEYIKKLPKGHEDKIIDVEIGNDIWGPFPGCRDLVNLAIEKSEKFIK